MTTGQTAHRVSAGSLKPEAILQRTIIIAWLLVLLAGVAHSAEPSLAVTIEEKSQFITLEQLYIGQVTLAVQFRVESDQTVDVDVECVFRVPRRGLKTIHISQGHVLAGQPAYGRFEQWVPNGFVGWGEDDWKVDCEARPR